MQTLVIRALLTFTSWLPLGVNHALGAVLGRLLALLPNDARRVTRINLERCLPELTDTERRRLERASLVEMVRTGLELGPMWLWSQSRCLNLIRSIHGEALLNQALADGNGVILIIPHIGMWELIGIYGSSHFPMTSLYRPPRMHGLDNIMRHGRERFGATLVPTDAQGIRHLYRALARGELIAILPDQEPRWGNGVFAPFFGLQAYTATLLPRIAHKSRATMLLAWAERLPGARGFDLHFAAVADDCSADDPVRAATAINAEVERCARTLPGQYQWHYRRFRTRPEGEAAGFYGRKKRRKR